MERGFLSLAEEWHRAAVATGPDRALPPAADQAALACLLITKERAGSLGQDSKRMIQANYTLREPTHFKICDSLVWELCAAGFFREPGKAPALSSLVYLLGHPDSGLRIWGMDLGWVLRDRLPARRVVPILLRNIANTLGGVDQAAGLATTFFKLDEGFFKAADAFKAPPGFQEQFDLRIAKAKEFGAGHYQIPFLELEVRLRKLVADRCFC